MPGQDSLEHAVRAAGIDAPPRYVRETASTNTDALAAAEEGAPEWTVVAAGHQTAGRGRLGRTWTSVPGRALLVSVILRPPLEPSAGAVVSLLAAERMAGACEEAAGVDARTKWPNDLLAGERKLGGILPEARVAGGRLEHLVVGLGVNVSMGEEDLPPGVPATSLALEGGEATVDELLEAFLRGFRAAYRPGAPGFVEAVVQAYQGRCATLGRRVRVETTAGSIEGTAIGLDGRGALVVRSGGRTAVVGFGEVVHLDQGGSP